MKGSEEGVEVKSQELVHQSFGRYIQKQGFQATEETTGRILRRE